MKPLILTVCLASLAWNTHAQQLHGNQIDQYELAVPATFAITLSEASSLNQAAADTTPQTITLTSSNIVKFYDLPDDARCYWVFDFEAEDTLLAGAMVIASKETGEIYKELAYGFGITLFELIDGGGQYAEGVGVMTHKQNQTSVIANMAMTWNLGSDVAPIVTFGRFALQIEDNGDHSTVSFGNLTDLTGDGLEGSGLMVTKGRMEAKGEVLEIAR